MALRALRDDSSSYSAAGQEEAAFQLFLGRNDLRMDLIEYATIQDAPLAASLIIDSTTSCSSILRTIRPSTFTAILAGRPFPIRQQRCLIPIIADVCFGDRRSLARHNGNAPRFTEARAPRERQGRQSLATTLASSPPRNATITGRRVDHSAALLRITSGR